MNAEIIAILGHESFELPQRRHDALRPHREFSTLCASHVPITKYLFGDELQTQINPIRTSNKIGNATTSSSNSTLQQHSKQGKRQWRPF